MSKYSNKKINQNKLQKENQQNILQQMVNRYFAYWPFFMLTIFLAISFAFIYLNYTIPIYEASAMIIVKDDKKGNEESKMLESLDQISSKSIIENEIEIIQSRKLMHDVINKLELYAPIFKKVNFKKISSYSSAPITVISPSPDSLIKVKEIKLDFEKDSNFVYLNEKYRYPINEIVSTPFGRLKFVNNKNYIKSEKPQNQFYFSLIEPKALVTDLLKNLKVEASSKLSTIVKISYRDEDPDRGENLLNQLIKSYDQSEFDKKNALAKYTLSFVEERLNLITHDLDSIEKRIQRFKSIKTAVNIGVQGQLYLQNVSANDQKLSEVNTQLSVLKQVHQFVTDKSNSANITLSTIGIDEPILSNLLNELNTSELEYEKLKKTVGEGNSILIAITDRINKLKSNILQNIKSQEQSLNASKQSLNLTNENYNSILQTVPQKERQLLDISRLQATKSNLYAFLLQKKEESELSYASTAADHTIIDAAHADMIPVSPRKLLVLFTAIVFGLVFFIVVIYMREIFSNKILFRNEIEFGTSIPVLGEVAYDTSNISLKIHAGTNDFIAEQLNKIIISKSILDSNNAKKKILVTSSIKGEGKSFIAINLAISLSQIGKKVILLDMNLRNPSLERIFKVSHEEGIIEFLKGQKKPEEIINAIKDYKNLFFIPTGKLPENSISLLTNGKINEIFTYLEHFFDIVIIDTSPIAIFSDTYLLSPICDTTLFVVRHNFTPKIFLKRLENNNQINEPSIIFNGVKIRGFFKKNNGNGYGYD